MSGENTGLWEKLKGTRAKVENKRLKEKIKGADSAEGENKMHEGGKNVNWEILRITVENKGHKELRRKIKG